MTGYSFVIALALMLFASAAWAQQSDPAPEVTDQWAAEQVEHAADQARLDELMGILAEEMAAIRKAKNAKERDALMPTHHDHMREAMSLARGMGGMHMREVMEEHMAVDSDTESKSSERRVHSHKRMVFSRPRSELSDAQRLDDLEMRVDMMQMMMESMMDEPAKQSDTPLP